MNQSKTFAIVGVAGYVAPRHLKAIKETGNQLVAAYDPCDSVGILDRFFPETAFFTEFERFDRHLEKLRSQNTSVDFLVVCSPNYLHDAHCRLGMRLGADVICEKPLVLNPWNLDALQHLSTQYAKKLYSILQLRLHKEAIRLKKYCNDHPNQSFDVDLTYITSRGLWYYTSWKSDVQKSGGISTNIGVHLFDLLCWIFGEFTNIEVHQNSHDRSSGVLNFKNAHVKWFLSINPKTLPAESIKKGERTYRNLRINDQHFDFSEGFEDLHTISYERILRGEGFNVEECRYSIELCRTIRVSTPKMAKKHEMHPLALINQDNHPFTKT